MNDEHLTPAQVWEDFWKWYMANPPSRIPNELAVADLTHRGMVKKPLKNGNRQTVKLGVERIARLLEKYAPGKYTYHEYFVRVK